MRLLLFITICWPFWAPAQSGLPVFSKPAGFYTGPVLVEMTAPAGQDIRYTLDGDSVTGTSKRYQTALKLTQTAVLRARCFPTGPNGTPGKTVTQTFLVDENVQLPVVSLTVRPYHLWDYDAGIYADGYIDTCAQYPFPCANYWQGWEKPAFVEYFDEGKHLVFAQDCGIEITGGWSKASPKKGILVQFDHDDFGGGKVKNWSPMPDKPQVSIWKNLHLRPGGNGQFGQFGHDAWLQKTVKGTNCDFIAYQSAHLFLNGEYWGVYEMRERQDKHFIQYNYGVDKDLVDILRFPESSDFYGITNYYAVQAGSDSTWKRTVGRLWEANPTGAGFYQLIDSEFDLANYIDYYAVQTFIGNNDWLGPWFNNIRVWRPQKAGAKWRYMLWDLDGSLGEQWDKRYTPCFDNINYARHPDGWDKGWSVEHSWMFDKMCQNPQFRERFARRYSDLLNTVFQPANLEAVSDDLMSELKPDIARDFARWNHSSLSFWEGRFAANLGWAAQRRYCVGGHVARALSLEGHVAVSVTFYPPEAGRASVGTAHDIEGFWNGIFFKDFDVPVAAEPKNGWVFSHWDSEGDRLLHPDSARFEQKFKENTTLTAYFIQKETAESFQDGAAVYPNPSDGWVFVQSEKPIGLCQLFDAAGRFVRRFQTESRYISFDVKGLPGGVYFLKTEHWVKKIGVK